MKWPVNWQLARGDWKQSFSGSQRLKIDKNSRYQCRFEPIFQTRKLLELPLCFLTRSLQFFTSASCWFFWFDSSKTVGNALYVFYPVTTIKLILTIKAIKLLSEGVCISCPFRLTLATDIFPCQCLLVHLPENVMRSFRNGFHCFEQSFWEE